MGVELAQLDGLQMVVCPRPREHARPRLTLPAVLDRVRPLVAREGAAVRLDETFQTRHGDRSINRPVPLL
jgi:hypothetical protein